ncbi:carcinoembryonic antigen-related cell adhesion molecule 1 [Nannospalax galili]|uniref:carcinoembryonic antigen-related cell adhesion molecule 1 n=1 Tax=Nannospalax galili TaxID=1026970 RepID=UPI000819E94F|nr:carcinoembryonic antigen-related cell adhesion molecule 1 [Nannospalax galili]
MDTLAGPTGQDLFVNGCLMERQVNLWEQTDNLGTALLQINEERDDPGSWLWANMLLNASSRAGEQCWGRSSSPQREDRAALTTEPLSAPPRTGSICWQRLLFTASLLTFWSSPTSAQLHVELVPPLVAEGKNVLLVVHNLPENVFVFYWYKGKRLGNANEIARYLIPRNENRTGPAHSGRETIFPNGSLLFQNVNQNDTGFYTLQTFTPRGDRNEIPVQLHVHPDPGQGSSGLSGGAIAGIVVGAGAGVALIAGLGYFLYSRKTGRSCPSDNSSKKGLITYAELDSNSVRT